MLNNAKKEGYFARVPVTRHRVCIFFLFLFANESYIVHRMRNEHAKIALSKADILSILQRIARQ